MNFTLYTRLKKDGPFSMSKDLSDVLALTGHSGTSNPDKEGPLAEVARRARALANGDQVPASFIIDAQTYLEALKKRVSDHADDLDRETLNVPEGTSGLIGLKGLIIERRTLIIRISQLIERLQRRLEMIQDYAVSILSLGRLEADTEETEEEVAHVG